MRRDRHDGDGPRLGAPGRLRLGLAPRRGRANIPGFFESLAPLHFTRFEPHTFFADGDKVFALIHIDLGSSALDTRTPGPVSTKLAQYWPLRSAVKLPFQ